MIRSCVVLCIYRSALLDGVLHHFMNAREHSMLISASPTRSSNPLIILAGGSYEEASSVPAAFGKSGIRAFALQTTGPLSNMRAW